jgi:YHS domain-containing protein
MKRLLHLLTVASVAAVPVVGGNSAVGASDKQTLGAAQNTLTNGQTLVAQNGAVKEAKGTKSAKVNVDGNGVILKGYDAVAFFEQGKPVKGNPEIKVTYQGATYLFASEADKAAFEKDSAKYAPQYGGFCAYGVVKGALDDYEDLFVFTIYKGKLYLCGNPGALEIFMTNIDDKIDTADSNWRQLTGT